MGSTEIPLSTAGDLETRSHLAIIVWSLHINVLHGKHGKACDNEGGQEPISNQQCARAYVITGKRGHNWPYYYLVENTETNLI